VQRSSASFDAAATSPAWRAVVAVNRSGGGGGVGDADVSPTMNNDLVTRTCVRELAGLIFLTP